MLASVCLVDASRFLLNIAAPHLRPTLTDLHLNTCSLAPHLQEAVVKGLKGFIVRGSLTKQPCPLGHVLPYGITYDYGEASQSVSRYGFVLDVPGIVHVKTTSRDLPAAIVRANALVTEAWELLDDAHKRYDMYGQYHDHFINFEDYEDKGLPVSVLATHISASVRHNCIFWLYSFAV